MFTRKRIGLGRQDPHDHGGSVPAPLSREEGEGELLGGDKAAGQGAWPAQGFLWSLDHE